MAGTALELELTVRVPDNPGHHSERCVGTGEHRPLLDMEFEKRGWQRTPARHEGPASDASDLLTSENDDRSGADPLDGLDPRHDTQRAVEAAAPRHRVEMGSGPHVAS